MKKRHVGSTILSVVFVLICLCWLLPIGAVLNNSLKSNASINTDTFALPNEESFVGLQNYIKGMTFGNYPFYKSALYTAVITLASTFLILLCTSMSAWYVARVGSLATKIFYYLCVFSMIVPFQMVMFTLTTTADMLKLNTPWTIPVVYLGFGAGLAVFMFTGFVKSLPLEIEEAAAIDGCGPIRTFFAVVLPMMRPTLISVGILEIMWIWNDFLLPYLIIGANIQTIPIAIQNMKMAFGSIDYGHLMAAIIAALVPVVLFYFCCQRYIIEGIVSGAVKG